MNYLLLLFVYFLPSSFSQTNSAEPIDLQSGEPAPTTTDATTNPNTESPDDSILAAQAVVERYIVNIDSENSEFVEKIQERKERIESLRAELTANSENIASDLNTNIQERFTNVNLIWGNAADEILDLFDRIKIESEYELPDPLSANTLIENDAVGPLREYANTYQKAKAHRIALAESKSTLLNELKAQNFRLLNDAGSLRARLIRACTSKNNCQRPPSFSQENLTNLWREIRVLPLRFLAGGLAKWLEVGAKFKSGIDGWMDIAAQMAALIFLFLVPFFISKTLNWISLELASIKREIISKSMMDYRQRTGLATWITRLMPFINPAGMVLSLYIARSLIRATDLSVLSSVLYYLQLYFLYRIFKILIKIGFEIGFSAGSAEKLKVQKRQIERSAARISRLIFIQYALLEFIEDTVRRALFYNLASSIIFWATVFVVVLELKKWKTQIYDSFAYRFPKIWKKIQPALTSLAGSLLTPLLVVAVITHDVYRFISRYLARLDIVKRFLSEVIRRRLENAEKTSQNYAKPSDEYCATFDYYLPAQAEFFIDREDSPIKPIVQLAKNWFRTPENTDLVIIVGNRGMGKTTTLDKIHDEVDCQDLLKVLSKVPAKTTSQEQLFSWLSELFETEIHTIEEFKEFDRMAEQKSFICVDDIQNLFLGNIGGFEAYKLFIDIISLKTKNIFWCLTVNSRSWAYLRGIFGEEHFYGQVFSLTAWSEEDIKNLILCRHRVLNYSRTFDESIRSYGAGDAMGEKAESQFFRLLWGQSRGNPRSAMMYWVSAISSPSPKTIHVGVPSFVGSHLVSSMSDDAFFILAAIARHESLTHEELRITTEIDGVVIRKCVNEALQKELIWIDELDRIRISSRSQYVIDYFLIGKNFLYE
jgi:hypothetical protein